VTTATPIRSQQRPPTKEEIERMKREKEEQSNKEALRPKKDDRKRPADPAKRGPGTGT
jgi:hypothetical protein